MAEMTMFADKTQLKFSSLSLILLDQISTHNQNCLKSVIGLQLTRNNVCMHSEGRENSGKVCFYYINIFAKRNF